MDFKILYIIELCFFALLAMPRKTNSHSSLTKYGVLSNWKIQDPKSGFFT
jgi:hypothetical protein